MKLRHAGALSMVGYLSDAAAAAVVNRDILFGHNHLAGPIVDGPNFLGFGPNLSSTVVAHTELVICAREAVNPTDPGVMYFRRVSSKRLSRCGLYSQEEEDCPSSRSTERRGVSMRHNPGANHLRAAATTSNILIRA